MLYHLFFDELSRARRSETPLPDSLGMNNLRTGGGRARRAGHDQATTQGAHAALFAVMDSLVAKSAQERANKK